jgi:uncharacterized iron-regulated protein
MRFIRNLAPVACALGIVFSSPAVIANQCVPDATWMEPVSGKTVSQERILKKLAKQKVVLLGEDHDNAEHHRWQLHTIAQIHALNKNIAIGFESFPRHTQDILDRWVAGELSEKELLEQTDWNTIWNFDANLYLPMFHYARMHKIPMIALNIPRTMVSMVSEQGWENIPEDDRQGVGNPAPAVDEYKEILAEVFGQHMPGGDANHGHGSSNDKSPHESSDHKSDPHAGEMEIDEDAIKAQLAEIIAMPAFQRFMQGQLLWDRAMAEAIDTALQRNNVDTVIGIMGAGHVMGGYGVAHQLRDLGEDKIVTMMPWDGAIDCEQLKMGVADYVFGLAQFESPESKTNKPKLGVYLEPDEDGVKVSKIVKDSVAQQSGIQPGDYIKVIAGLKVDTVSQVIESVQATAFGTWLPLTVQRGDKDVDIVAKFPRHQ